ncbi:MAG: hypothetical protein OQK32_02175, partial [Gammaproteobacteria bacterium]|nr:hypothetical protein [Gammaproteobacteria bacterium]
GLGGGLGATDGSCQSSDAGGGAGGGGFFGTGGVGSLYSSTPGGSGGNGGSSATGTGNGGSGSTVDHDSDGDYSGGSGGGGFGNGDGGAAGNSTDATETLGRDGGDGDTSQYVMPDTGGVVKTYVLGELATLLANNPNYGAGDDVLDGGAGSDSLVGLGGNDVFYFELDDASSGTDTDTVWDLNAGDVLVVASGGSSIPEIDIINALAAQVPNGNDRTITVTNGTNSMDILVKDIARDLVIGDFDTTFDILAGNSAPTAGSLFVSGTGGSVGDTLTGNYTYDDVDGNPEGVSTFRWLRDGVAISGATSSTYAITATDEGTIISFEVTPVAQNGVLNGVAVESLGVVIPGPAANDAPTASNVSLADDNGGDVEVGDSLTASYTYSDAEGDAEGVSMFQWYNNGVAISGATTLTYTLVDADDGQYINFEVTPVADSGTTPGNAVASSGVIVGTGGKAPVVVVEDDDGFLGIGSFSIWTLFMGFGLWFGRLFRQ